MEGAMTVPKVLYIAQHEETQFGKKRYRISCKISLDSPTGVGIGFGTPTQAKQAWVGQSAA
jgi:hypothetical protein